MHIPIPSRTTGRVRRPRRIAALPVAFSLAAGLLLGTSAGQHPATAIPASAPAAETGPLAHALTGTQAQAQARATGKPVTATALTTATTQTTANANGSFTQTISPTPVRVLEHGSWTGLDANLHRNPDGTYSPTASTAALTLSGGGHGPLAQITYQGRSLTLTLPTTLPAPTVSGETATYTAITPGVNLIVTATAQGGFSDVFQVENATAATGTPLAALMKAQLTGHGLTITTDKAGDINATAPGTTHPVFTAPSATMWDSATSGSTPAAGAPADSGARAAGRYAHTANLHAAYAAGVLTLSPPAAMLNATGHTFPEYIDPSFAPNVSGWTMVNSQAPTQSYWGSGTSGYMQVGYDGWPASGLSDFTARSFVSLSLSGIPSGAQISAASVDFFEAYAPSCLPSSGQAPYEVDLWQTGAIGTGTTWDNQPAWDSELGSSISADGYTSSCPANYINFTQANSSIETAIINSLPSGSITLGLQAPSSYACGDDCGNDLSWKQFNQGNSGTGATTASVTYDLYPNTPSDPYTSPAPSGGSCGSTTVGTIGNSSVALYATASTADSPAPQLTTSFALYTGTTASGTNLLTSLAGDSYTGAPGLAALQVPQSVFATAANGADTEFTWTAQTYDGTLTSKSASTCTFYWNPTVPARRGSPRTKPRRPGTPPARPSATPPTPSSRYSPSAPSP